MEVETTKQLDWKLDFPPYAANVVLVPLGFPFAWADDFFETVWKLVQAGTKGRGDGSEDSH